MKNFKPQVEWTHYSVPVVLEHFLALAECDFQCGYDEDDLDIPTFDEALEGVGCVDVDYNGHFGKNIFFKLDGEDDTPARWKEIEAVFVEYIRITTEWKTNQKA